MELKKDKTDFKFTYKDYCSWPEEERWELICGKAYNMSPAPSRRHQEISFELSGILREYLKGKDCKAFAAPFDVMLPGFPVEKEDEIDTVVQPDISVICNPTKITDKGCLGAPDLIIEILSPATFKKDLNEKFQLYEKHGVREYWIVDPDNRYFRIFHLLSEDNTSGVYDNGTISPPADRVKGDNTIAKSDVLKGFQVDVKKLFDTVG